MENQKHPGLREKLTKRLIALRHERIQVWCAESRFNEPPDSCVTRLGIHLDGLAVRDLSAGVPARYKPWRLWHFHPDAADDSIRFLVHEEASTLYLHGDIGTGKTSLAAAILHAWRWSGGACNLDCPVNCGAIQAEYGRFLPAYEAAARLRNLDRCGAAMAEWAYARLLVLDDIGANRATPHVQEQLLFLLQQRYDRMQKTIVTSNLDLNGMGVDLGDRAASRLQEGILVELTGGDKRAGKKEAGDGA
jgi:hypothetical protein